MRHSVKQLLSAGFCLLVLCLPSQALASKQNSATTIMQITGGAKGSSGTTTGGGTSGGSPEVLFQDLKTFLGATNAAHIEAAKILLYMLPPFYDITAAVSSRMNAGEVAKQGWQDKQLRKMAEYNVATKKRSPQDLLADRVNYCLDDQGKPAKYCNYDNKNSGNDVLASSLLDTLAFDNDGERLAALQYIKNLTNYSPMPYPGDDVVYKDKKDKNKGMTQEGIDYFAKAYKNQSILTMAQNALLNIFADRTRFENFSKDLPVGKNGNASVMEMLYYEVSRRYMNQNWYEQMNKSSDSAMLREIANMLALQNYMQLKQYEQNAQIEAMMAAQLSVAAQTNIQADSVPKVDSDKLIEDLP